MFAGVGIQLTAVFMVADDPARAVTTAQAIGNASVDSRVAEGQHGNSSPGPYLAPDRDDVLHRRVGPDDPAARSPKKQAWIMGRVPSAGCQGRV